jgi:hypothetical protein
VEALMPPQPLPLTHQCWMRWTISWRRKGERSLVHRVALGGWGVAAVSSSMSVTPPHLAWMWGLFVTYF